MLQTQVFHLKTAQQLNIQDENPTITFTSLLKPVFHI